MSIRQSSKKGLVKVRERSDTLTQQAYQQDRTIVRAYTKRINQEADLSEGNTLTSLC